MTNGLTITADGTASSDADGTIVAYAWDFGDGSTANADKAVHDYSGAGTYQVSLTVTDNSGATASSTKAVSVAARNIAPTASFTTSAADLTISFDASTSKDQDGAIASYEWEFGDGTTGTGVKPSHPYAQGGTYQVKLTVTDNAGATATTAQSLTVIAPPVNSLPTATFAKTSSGLTINVDGSDSSDADGTIVKYDWDFGDGTTDATSGASAVHTYAGAGTYSVKLTVTDNNDGTGQATQSVSVIAPPPANVPPTASFAATPSGLTVDVDATGSSDPDGTIMSYSWQFGDGTSDVGETVSHSYLAAGTYTVMLTVTDDQGATDTASKDVAVSGPASPLVFGSDTFGRTLTNSWGQADVGGQWTMNGSPALFSVGGGTGKLKMKYCRNRPFCVP